MRPKRASSWNIRRTRRGFTGSAARRFASTCGSFFSSLLGPSDRPSGAGCPGRLCASHGAPTSDIPRSQPPADRRFGRKPRVTRTPPASSRPWLVPPRAPRTSSLPPKSKGHVYDHPNSWARLCQQHCVVETAPAIAPHWRDRLRAAQRSPPASPRSRLARGWLAHIGVPRRLLPARQRRERVLSQWDRFGVVWTSRPHTILTLILKAN